MSTPSPSNARFVWHDLMTPDPAASAAFYTDLFGWSTQTTDMGELGDYTMFATGDTPHSGVVHLDTDSGHPPHWICYLGVADVDAAAQHAAAHDGRVLVEPFDIPTVGRTAVLADPAGAVFSPFRGDDPDGMPASSDAAGFFSWHELLTSDAEAVLPFYTGLTGWATSEMDMGENGIYRLFHPGAEAPIAGMMEMQGLPPHWTPYVGVSDLDAVAAQVETLGGSFRMPATRVDDPVNVYFAIALDPQGAAFGLLQI